MPDDRGGVAIRCVETIADVAALEWDACAGDDNPFVSHAFLLALEESGSATGKTGWTPNHVIAEDAEGRLLGCAPLYVKSHSYGEYVFDWGWAEAWTRAGRRYYPKLQIAVPFTPVTGPRFLVRPGVHAEAMIVAMAEVMTRLAGRAGLSSVHVTFAPEAQARALEAQGWLLRAGEQFHWHNRGYASFDEFLAALSSRKRKAIRRERAQANSDGIKIAALTGAAITEAHWDAFFGFYMNTAGRKWGHAYLNREFFSRLGATLAHRVVLMMAERDGRPFAGALNLLGGDALYGRNWGAVGEMPFLHFELCYYRAIDYAIEHRLARVEAGAQGEHKISRGYLPVATWSAHWIREAPFKSAVARFLEAEREAVAQGIREQTEAGPYRHEEN